VLDRDLQLPAGGHGLQRAHSRFTAALGRLLMRVSGWRFEGELPDVRRVVLIVAPHTSNWDFLVGLQAKLALRLGCTFIGKHTLFRFPLGILMRWLGGIPVDRSAPGGIVDEVVGALRRADQMTVVVAPEGTRRRVAQWKSGFYRIASEAGVPILPVGFDYERRIVFFAPLFQPSGDYEKDLPKLRGYYRAEMARKPDNYA
jgi:1-acyl-sn-glycerol-3-phosphate acyltransferase